MYECIINHTHTHTHTHIYIYIYIYHKHPSYIVHCARGYIHVDVLIHNLRKSSFFVFCLVIGTGISAPVPHVAQDPLYAGWSVYALWSGNVGQWTRANGGVRRQPWRRPLPLWRKSASVTVIWLATNASDWLASLRHSKKAWFWIWFTFHGVFVFIYFLWWLWDVYLLMDGFLLGRLLA